MKKILLIANPCEKTSEIQKGLEQKYKIQTFLFDKNEVSENIVSFNPALIVVYLKEISQKDFRTLRLMLADEKISRYPAMIIGTELDYRDYIATWGGNIAGVVLTPTTLTAVMDKISLIFEAIEKKTDIIKDEEQIEDSSPTDFRKHIMIIDDDPVILRAMMKILKDKYKTSVAKSGAAAFALLGSQKPDLILLDYMMPVCDGLQTLQMIRAEKTTKDIPVFFLTGVNDSEYIKNAMALRPEGYILKSTSQNEILKRIGDFFAKDQ